LHFQTLFLSSEIVPLSGYGLFTKSKKRYL